MIKCVVLLIGIIYQVVSLILNQGIIINMIEFSIM